MGYTIGDGRELVEIARDSLELFLKSARFRREIVSKSFSDRAEHGRVLVRFLHHGTSIERGASFKINNDSIVDAIVDATIDAASNDKSQVPLSKNEASQVLIEVNIILDLVPLSKSYIKRRAEIEIMKDGLLLEYGKKTTILLPSIAFHNRFDRTQFLEELCVRSDLDRNKWKQASLNISKFKVQTFVEETPGGAVLEQSRLNDKRS